CSRLQFCLQLFHESQVEALSDDFLWRRLDHSDFIQSQRIKAQAILNVISTPAIVRQRFEYFQGDVVARFVALGNDRPGRALRITCTAIRSLENGANCSLRCHRISARKLGMSGNHAAEILLPRSILAGIDDYAPDVASAQLLRLRGERKERVGLS